MEDGKKMIKVLYEDNSIIVVYKEAGILSQGDKTGDISLLDMVKDYIKKEYNKPGNVYIGLVHRLDRPVSGIMVFARNSKSASRLSEQIRNHKLKKEYIAVVNGIIEKDEDTLTDYLIKKDDLKTYVTTKEKGKYSSLSYKVLARDYKKNETLVKINLETGRHHQIRVQFASRGYTLCGDAKYGSKGDNLALCAYKLTFNHPITKEEMTFKINLPNNKYFNDFKGIV